MRGPALALLCLLATGASAAGADSFVAAPLGTTGLDFDTEAGRYSQWRLEHLDGIDAVRATVIIHRLAVDARWAPTFTIQLQSGKDAVTLQFASRSRQPPMTMEATVAKGGKDVDDQDFERTVDLEERLPLSIDWSADGTVILLVGGEKHTLALGEPITALEITGSTGEVQFDPLQIGRSQR
jgi:hypothetical protein